MTADDYIKNLKLDYISTFDIKDKDVNTQQTLLDKRLVKLQSDYGYYLNGLQKQFTGYLNKLSDGWGGKAIHMEDITTNTRK